MIVCEAATMASLFEICRTSEVPDREHRRKAEKSTRSVLPRQGQPFLRSEKGQRRQKDLILLVGSRCLGALIRGLQNLETPRRGTVLFFSLVRKEPKVHQRFANLWTPGTIQIAGRYGVFAKMTGVHQVTGSEKSCNFEGYRRQ